MFTILYIFNLSCVKILKEEKKGLKRAFMEENYKPYRIVTEGGEGGIEEKKSRFLANIFPAETEEEALAQIEGIRKKYWDARHHCYAYIIGNRAQLVRCSDDGEPAGTAGRPILEVLTGQKLNNVTAVVTRYFGGTLLGTGGLVRAYTQAVQAGLTNAKTGLMRYGTLLRIQTDYNGIGRIQYLMGQRGLTAQDIVYGQEVVLKVCVTQEKKEAFWKAVTEATGGRAVIIEEDSFYFIDKEEQF